MKLLKHLIAIVLPLFLLIGLPVLTSDTYAAYRNGTDAISSATVILDAPSGDYVVLINRTRHEAKDTLSVWEDFFSGKDIGIVFEDIDCIVGAADPSGLEFAKSLQSRLPENQMRLRTEEMTLLLSKARAGYTDIVIFSKEAFDAYGVDTGQLLDTSVVFVSD